MIKNKKNPSELAWLIHYCLKSYLLYWTSFIFTIQHRWLWSMPYSLCCCIWYKIYIFLFPQSNDSIILWAIPIEHIVFSFCNPVEYPGENWWFKDGWNVSFWQFNQDFLLRRQKTHSSSPLHMYPIIGYPMDLEYLQNTPTATYL